MPDWKNEADYAFTEDLTPEGWAWEFLLRNRCYQTDFETVQKILGDFSDKYGSERANWPKEQPAFEFTPPREDGESIKAWRARCVLGSGDPPRIIPVDQWYGQKWGLRGRIGDPSLLWTAGVVFVPPSDYAQLIVKVDDLEGLIDEVETVDGEGLNVFSDRVGVVVFDMRYPLPKQLKLARERLKRHQGDLVAEGGVEVEATKMHRKKWTRYLRALDARATGASFKDIGLDLGPGHSDEYPEYTAAHYAKDTLNQAAKLVDGGYKSILLMSE